MTDLVIANEISEVVTSEQEVIITESDDEWCSQRLAELGFKYGDMPSHNLLWRECEKSSDNIAARLAVISLVQVMVSSKMPGNGLPPYTCYRDRKVRQRIEECDVAIESTSQLTITSSFNQGGQQKNGHT